MKMDYAHYHKKIVVDGIQSRMTFITSKNANISKSYSLKNMKNVFVKRRDGNCEDLTLSQWVLKICRSNNLDSTPT